MQLELIGNMFTLGHHKDQIILDTLTFINYIILHLLLDVGLFLAALFLLSGMYALLNALDRYSNAAKTKI